VFRSTIQNFKTLRNMFDKHNMRNFEPTKESVRIYEKESMNTDYLNYLNDFNKQQLRYYYCILGNTFQLLKTSFYYKFYKLTTKSSFLNKFYTTLHKKVLISKIKSSKTSKRFKFQINKLIILKDKLKFKNVNLFIILKLFY
jgi:hypothetical protein